jgi:5-methylcytosine-specific restriction endonuclease McrA
MTKRDGLPCRGCGTSAWYASGKCIECQKRHAHKWYKNNKEKMLATGKKWAKEHPERASEYYRNSARRQREKRPQAVKDSYRKWYGKNKHRFAEKVRKRAIKWAKDNPDRVKAIQHKRRAKKKKAGGSFTVYEWQALCKRQNYRCLACGKRKKLTADHVVPIALGGSTNIDNIQGLCLSCNASKGIKVIDYRTKKNTKRWIQPELF